MTAFSINQTLISTWRMTLHGRFKSLVILAVVLAVSRLTRSGFGNRRFGTHRQSLIPTRGTRSAQNLERPVSSQLADVTTGSSADRS